MRRLLQSQTWSSLQLTLQVYAVNFAAAQGGAR